MDRQMMILYVVLTVPALFAIGGRTERGRRASIRIATIALSLFSGLRTWWFGDLIKYYTLYRSCNGENGWQRVFEDFANVGIRIYFRLMGGLGISYDICIFLIAAFSAITLGILIYRYSPEPFWSYLIYIAMGFYIFTYSGLKQTIAMGFVCLAAMGILEDNPRSFTIWTLAGGVFHLPALIFLAAYPVTRQKFTYGYFAKLMLVVAVVFLFRDRIITLFTEAYYETEKTYEVSKLIGGRLIMMVLIMVASMILRPLHWSDREYCTVLHLMIIAAVIQFFSIYDNVFTRLADYYYQFVVLFLPMMLESGEHQLRRNPAYAVRVYDRWAYVLMWLFVIAFSFWFYRQQIDSTMLKDFKFFWEINPYDLYGK